MDSDKDPHPSTSKPYDPTDKKASHRAWQLVIWSGMFQSVYTIFATGAPRTGFFKELGFGPKEFGIITGLSSLAVVLQVVSGMISLRLSHFRKAYILLLTVSRLMTLALLSVPFLSSEMSIGMRTACLCAIVFLHDLFAQLSNPLWTAWMGELIPPGRVARDFAIRQKMLMISSLFAMVVGGVLFHFFETHGYIIRGYVIFALVGLVLGFIDISLYFIVPDPGKTPVMARASLRETIRITVPRLVEPLRDKRFRPFLYYMAAYQFAMAFCTPFYGIYMLSELNFSIMKMQLLNSLGTIAIILFAQQVGFLCDKLGLRSMLSFVSILKFSTPLLFILAPAHSPVLSMIFVGILMFTDGVIGSGWGIATAGYSIKYTPRDNRVMYVAVTNIICLGLVMGITPILAGLMIECLQRFGTWTVGPYVFGAYHISFLISIVLTFTTAGIVRTVHDPGAANISTMWKYIKSPATWQSMRAVMILQDSTDRDERINAIKTLGELHSSLGAHELLEACTDDDIDVSNSALLALERLGQKTEITQELLSRALAGREERAVRMHNLHLLGRVGNTTAIVPLINFWNKLPTQDSEMRRAVASTLARLDGNAGGTEAVINLLETAAKKNGSSDDDKQYTGK